MSAVPPLTVPTLTEALAGAAAANTASDKLAAAMKTNPELTHGLQIALGIVQVLGGAALTVFVPTAGIALASAGFDLALGIARRASEGKTPILVGDPELQAFVDQATALILTKILEAGTMKKPT